MVNTTIANNLKCPDCGHKCPLTDDKGVLVPDPKCPKCFKITGKQINMVVVNPFGAEVVVVGDQEKTPVLSGKDMNTLVYLLLGKVGTIEIPQEVFDTAPGPEKLTMERQWDGTNKIWRFFIKMKPKNRKRKPKLALPRKRIMLSN
jgi:hypothetical protein